jgi:hypothetical protein
MTSSVRAIEHAISPKFVRTSPRYHGIVGHLTNLAG